MTAPYAKQVEAATASHKRSGDYKGVDSDEYLSGFMKEDRLLSVVTLVIYFDSKEWDGPLSIYEMFDKPDARVLALVPAYKINLLAPASIEDELKKILDADESFRHLGREEVDVLNACAGAKILIVWMNERRNERRNVHNIIRYDSLLDTCNRF